MTYKKYTEIFNPPGIKGEVYGDADENRQKNGMSLLQGVFSCLLYSGRHAADEGDGNGCK